MRAIYGMLEAAILWYKKFQGELEQKGFKFNPYDPCVANRTEKGSQHMLTEAEHQKQHLIRAGQSQRCVGYDLMDKTVPRGTRIRHQQPHIVQDKKSAILLETNGKKSSGKRTRALNICYFFLTDQVEKGNVTIVYCPTDDMVGDFHTKPLQGEKFRKS
jgi:hypothetical protein